MKYSDKQLVVLMAGKGTRLYPLTLGFPKCLLSIKQKPALYNMLLPLINGGLRELTFVVNLENKSLIKDFMDNSFENIDLKINYVIQEDFSGPGAAFALTRKYINKNKSVILLLSDTLCKYPNNYDYSWIGVNSVLKEEKYKYCMVETKNNKIVSIVDKPDYDIDSNDAAIGLYFFKNAKILHTVLGKNITKKLGEYQLSSYFEEYMKEEDLYIENIKDWEDIGTLDGYISTNKNNFNCRHFNKLHLDKLGVLHKKSDFSKISSEINWFKEIEKTDFEKLSPKFYNSQKFDCEYGIEYYDYLTLSEYFTFYPLNDYSRQFIFENLLTKLLNIYKNNQIVSLVFNDLLCKMLIDKTNKRIGDWHRKDLSTLTSVNINGEEFVGLPVLMETLEPTIRKICDKSINFISIIHGDPAFSNILFSPRNMIFKFIDPRGNFGIDTVYGDYRYDLAKLRHCYHGRYDDIINDLFVIDEKKNKNLKLKFYRENDFSIYDKVMLDKDVDLEDVELIEGLLFISMIPLHKDYPDRQLAFFIQGIKILNNQLKRRGLND